MKHTLLYIVALFGAVATAATAGAATPAAPCPEWPVTEYNFGAFSEDDGVVTADFLCINTGTEPLIFVSARATCGCTTPRIPSQAIAPGDTAHVYADYDPAGRPGRFAKKIYITTAAAGTSYIAADNADNTQKTTLTLKGVVVASRPTLANRYPVSAGPLMLSRNALLMGTIDKGRAKTVFFDGYNATADTVQIAVGKTPKWLNINAVPEIVPPGEQVSLSFFANSDATPLYGVVTDTVAITATQPAQQPYTFNLPVILTVDENFDTLTPGQRLNAPVATVAEPFVSLGRVAFAPDKDITATYTVRNTGKSPLHIRRAYSMDNGVSVGISSTTVKPGKTARITVTVRPDSNARIVNVRTILITNDPASPTQTLRLTAERE